LSQHRGAQKMPTSTGKKAGLAVAVLVCLPFLIAGMISGVRQSLDSKPAAAASGSPLASASTPLAASHRASAEKPSPAAEPTFTYPGDPQCAITYHDDGNGTMSWTANVTVAGELITHASDSSGNINRRDVQVTPGPNSFAVPVPLSQIGDIGGVLYAGSASYGCSVAPLR
jgi:hypothetical protein